MLDSFLFGVLVVVVSVIASFVVIVFYRASPPFTVVLLSWELYQAIFFPDFHVMAICFCIQFADDFSHSFDASIFCQAFDCAC